MKKTVSLLLTTLLILLTLITGCGTKQANSRNPKYTYGTYSGNIESVYQLTGTRTQYSIGDYTDWGKASGDQLLVTISDTADGGVVAFSEEMYVYSPDNSDKNGVRSALATEWLNKK